MRNPTLGRHARNAQRSAHSELLPNVCAIVPALGYQGKNLLNLVRPENPIISRGIDGSNWSAGVLDHNGTDEWHELPYQENFPTQDFSILFFGLELDTNNDEMLCGVNTNSNANALAVYVNSSGRLNVWLEGNSNALVINGLLSTGVKNDLWIVRKNGSVNAYLNGIKNATQVTNTRTINYTQNSLTLFADADSGSVGSMGNYVDGRFEGFYFYDYGVDERSTYRLHLDPLAPFRLRQTPPVFVSGGGGTAVSNSIQTSLESIAPVGKAVSGGVESVSFFLHNLSTEIETSSYVFLKHFASLEILQYMTLEIESNSESLAASVLQTTTPLESLSVGVPVSNAIETQICSSQVQTSTAVTVIELLGATAKQSSTRIESTSTLSTQTATDTETLSATQNKSSAQIEGMAGHASSRQTSYEALGTDTVVSNAIRTEIGLNQSIQRVAATGAETHHSLSVQAVSRLESRGEILSGRVSGIEAGGSVQGMIETEYAYLTLVSQFAGVPIESLSGLSAPLMTSLEAAGSLAPIVGEIIIDGNFALELTVDAAFAMDISVDANF